MLRDFHVAEDDLDRVFDQLLPNRLAYVHGNTPRTKVGDNVYTSTEYPPELTISMHNELSYAYAWPARLLFYCRSPPPPVAPPRSSTATCGSTSLDDEVRERFAPGVRYRQNLHGGHGLGKSWQDTFETDSRDEVEKFLVDTAAEWSWQDDGTLRISQLRPAFTRHPVTGEEVWFNQSDQWHPAGLG